MILSKFHTTTKKNESSSLIVGQLLQLKADFLWQQVLYALEGKFMPAAKI